MDGVSVLVDLVVGESERMRENTATMLLNMIKSDKRQGNGVCQGDETEASMRALLNNNSEVSMRGKSKAKALLRDLESKRGSQL